MNDEHRNATLREVLDWAWDKTHPAQILARIVVDFDPEVPVQRQKEKAEWVLFPADWIGYCVTRFKWDIRESCVKTSEEHQGEFLERSLSFLEQAPVILWQISNCYNISTEAAEELLGGLHYSEHFLHYFHGKAPFPNVQFREHTANGLLPRVLADAVEHGWITSVACGWYKGITVLDCNLRQFIGAIALPYDKFQLLISTFSRWNADMDKHIADLMQKGEMGVVKS